MLQSLSLRAVLVAIFTMCLTHLILAVPVAPPFLSCSTECSDAFVIKYCDTQGCAYSSLPDCTTCQICRYRSAGAPNVCQRDTLVPNSSLSVGNCVEDCPCDVLNALKVEGKEFAQVGETIPNVPRFSCSNALVVAAE